MKLREVIENLHEMFEGEPWYGNCLSTYFQEIRPFMLNYSIGNGNSIGQIIEHMIFWREFIIERIENSDSEIPNSNPDLDWHERKFEESEKNALFARIRTTQKRLINTLEMHDDTLLDKMVPGRGYTFDHMLRGIINHDIYHLGQIHYLVSAAKRDHEDT